MAAKTAAGKGAKPAGEDVEAFLAALEHERKPEIKALRRILLAADPSITEGIKWNAPSFRTGEWFATFHLRAREGVQLILHLGAKARALPEGGLAVPDPSKLLAWLGKDRATVIFRDRADIDRRQAAFTELVRHWIRHV